MNKSIKYFGVMILGLMSYTTVVGQADWGITESEKAETLKIPFTEVNQEAGEELFNKSCKMCHSEMQIAPKNTRQLPLSPNLGSQEIQKQNSDGELFYKITKGHIATGMPSFAALSEDDRWKLVAYIRTFYPEYQPSANAGIAGPAAEKFEGNIKDLTLSFDTATGMAMAKLSATDLSGIPANAMNVKVNFYVQRRFAPLLIATIKTDGQSEAKVQIPADLPADTNGLMVVIAEVDKSELSKTIEVVYGEKLVYKNPLSEPALWGTRKNAPLWLKIMYLSAVIGVWLTIGWAGFQLFRVFNLRER